MRIKLNTSQRREQRNTGSRKGDYGNLGYYSLISFAEMRASWARLEAADLAQPYFATRRLWPLTSSERAVFRCWPHLGYAQGVGEKRRQFVGNALIARIVGESGAVGFHALMFGQHGWTFPEDVPGETKNVKIRTTVLPWSAEGRRAQLPPEAAVRLNPARDGVLAVAEGIETAMSFTRLTGRPCWAVMGVDRLARFPFPRGLKQPWIAQDNDTEGIAAAEGLQRMYPWARISRPSPPFDDFNNELLGTRA